MADINWSSSTVQSQHKVPHRLRKLTYQRTVHLLQFAALMVTTVWFSSTCHPTISNWARDDDQQHISQIERADVRSETAPLPSKYGVRERLP
jgi:hypothetical protein